nr:hypothetical protein [Prevotella sp.]
MNRILKTLLTIMLLATTATSQALDINTSEKKVYIYTADDLFALRGIIESYGFFKGYTLYLMNDIDLGGSARNFCNNIIGWEDKHEFQGTFDGQGHTISNLYIKIQNNNRGLFGWIYNATIRNLRLLNPYVEAGSSEYGHVGALVGKSEGGSLIENCAVIGGTVRPYLGADYDEIGGICGVMEDTGRILNCYCTSTVGAGRNEDRVGGILGSGQNNDSGNKIWITNCYFAGTTKGDGSVGALVGRQGNVRFSTCYWLETSGSWANGASKNNPSGTTKYTADGLKTPNIFGSGANNWVYTEIGLRSCL